jgi:hypothetical protein
MTSPQRTARIDRLRLRAAGLDEDAGRRLAQLVAQHLVPVLSTAPGAAALERLVVDVQQRPGDSVDTTAQRVAVGVADALRSRRDAADGVA